MILLDTDFLIDFFGGNPEALAKMNTIQTDLLAVSSISFYEIVYGELKKRRVFDSEEFVETFRVIPVGERETKMAVQIRLELEKSGGRIGWADEMIAATALSHQTVLITRNLKHFRRVKGLKIESW